MDRRRFLLGLSAAAGATGTLGSGAFTSNSAERAVSVDVVTDPDAYVGLTPTDDRASLAGDDELLLDFASSTAGSDGLNPDAQTTFLDLFEVRNRGDDTVAVAVGVRGEAVGVTGPIGPAENTAYERGPNGPGLLGDQPGVDDLQVYAADGGGRDAVDADDSVRMGVDEGGRVWLLDAGDPDGADSSQYLDPGESLRVDMTFLTNEDYADPQAALDPGIVVMAVEPGSDRDVSGSGGTGGGAGGSGGSLPAPVAYYPFDGTADDAANDYDGTLQGPGYVNGQSGFGFALSFDGDDYVRVPDDPALDLTGALTVAAWVRPDAGIGGYSRAVSREQSGVGNRQYNLGVDATATYPRTVVDTTSTNSVDVVGSTDVVDGDWHHVATTFDATDGLRLYVDGVEEDYAPASSPLVSRAADLVVGAPAQREGSYYFDGLVDEVRVYDRALTASEVGTLFGLTP
jgi:hypothetical protein